MYSNPVICRSLYPNLGGFEQPLPSAPILEDGIDYDGSYDINPQINFVQQYSVQQYSVQQYNNVQALAYKAYNDVYLDGFKVFNLPNPALSDKSIQTLKQIEDNSKKGVISGLLTLMIKVLQVVEKLALGIAIGTSLTLILSALFGSPLAVVLLSTFIAFPIMGNLVVGSLICKVAASVLGQARQKWTEHSFHLAIREENESVDVLKTWTQLQDLSQITQRFEHATCQIFFAQKMLSYPEFQYDQQIGYLNSLIQKINQFHALEIQLGMSTNSMPLLSHYLGT
jgi:hypothetical protein